MNSWWQNTQQVRFEFDIFAKYHSGGSFATYKTDDDWFLTNASWLHGFMSGGTTHTPPNWQVRAIADFNGDGKADVFWEDLSSGQLNVWLMNGGTVIADVRPSVASVDPNWLAVGAGDVDFDGHPDIVWWNKATGDLVVWFMGGSNGLTQLRASYVSTGMADPTGFADTTWQVMGVADFNADHHADLLWWQRTTGNIGVWYIDANAHVISTAAFTPSSQVADTTWRPVGVGDFNPHTSPDLVWWNTVSGGLGIWYMNGVAQQSAVNTTPNGVADVTWQVVGVGDFNGDGQTDIFWQNTVSGINAIWFMTGPTKTSGANPPPR
jgi:hypothetical protein